MKILKEYFKSEAIIFYLCRLRVSNAKKRNKKHLIHLLTSSDEFNYHINDKETQSAYEKKFNEDLNKLLPSRRKWKKLGKESRLNSKTNEKLSATDKNLYSLLKTIKFYKKRNPSEPFLLNLNSFIKDVQNSINDSNFKIEPPTIYPKLKDKIKKKGENKCRPISLFTLKDRLILSLTNKYLTILFDKYFEDCSFAFRAKRNTHQEETLSHHDCIKEILKFKSHFKQTDLWVVECDMEKFYDSVNHSIILTLFNNLVSKVNAEFPELDLSNPQRIFGQFLNAYSFNSNVLPLKEDHEYWKDHEIPNGKFEWVEKGIADYYNKIEEERIGIPQGGALSGLIANIVLDIADKEVRKTKVFYVRFCDDMILLHPDKEECELAKKEYKQALVKLKLVPHDFCSNNNLIVTRTKSSKNLPLTTVAPYWKQKSKGPYQWTEIKNDGFPWIGFVGYELHLQGHIRIRKRSLLKELKKQKEVVNQVKRAIEKNRRKSYGTIGESVIHRLVGMSVGRVEMRNYDKIEHDMCWKNGFKELQTNKYVSQQIRHLDRNRNKLYYALENELRKLKEFEKASEEPSKRKRQIVDFNKPFSYYYQVLERKQVKQSVVASPSVLGIPSSVDKTLKPIDN